MRYIATVEIEFETNVDSMMILGNILYEGFGKWRDERHLGGLSPPSMGTAEHYHVIEQPREVK